MKPLAAIAFAAIALALVAPAPAQRGGAARGGSSAHGAPSFHSSFTPSSSARSFSGPAYRYSGPSFAAPRIATAARFAVAPSAARPAFYSLRRPPIVDRRRYAPRVAVAAYPYYAYPYPFVDSSLLDPGYPADVPYDESSAQPIYADSNQFQQQTEPALPPPAPPTYAAPRQQPAPPEEEAVTLVFKDGRPSQQIHNYILTRKMLFVRDTRRQDIPVDQLDLAATEKANQANGVEFALPTAN